MIDQSFLNRMPGIAGAACALILAVTAFAQETKPDAPAQPKVTATTFHNLTVEAFATMAEARTNVILDVRTPGEFRAGHLVGAVNLDVNAEDFAAKAAALDKTKTYLVHCAAGGRSVKACGEMTKLGFSQLYNLSGGFKAWAKAGKPIEK